MVLKCSKCDCTKLLFDHDSQSMCCTVCGLLFDATTVDESETTQATTERVDDNSFAEPVNQSNCISIPYAFKFSYLPKIELLKAHFNTTDEETEFVKKLCRDYLYHPHHVYCRCPIEVTLCVFYLVLLQHCDSGARSLSDYCQQLEANPRRCLRIYTAMRSILADQITYSPFWYDPVHHLDNIMTSVYPSLVSSSPPFVFTLHMDIKKKRKRKESTPATPTPVTWPKSMSPRKVRSRTIQLIDFAKNHGFSDGRHNRPLSLICLIIVCLSQYYYHNPDNRTADINIHWSTLASRYSFCESHRAITNRYREILRLIHSFATSLPWLKHVQKKKDREVLAHLDDILVIRDQAPESKPPAYQRAHQLQERHRAVLDNPDKDPRVFQWLTTVIQSGKWSMDTILSMSDSELANRAHRLNRPLDLSHDLDRPVLDDYDLSKEEQAVYLV